MGRGFGFRTCGEGAVVYVRWPGIEYGSVAEGIHGTCNWHNQVADSSAQVLSSLGFGGNAWTVGGRTFWGEQNIEKGAA